MERERRETMAEMQMYNRKIRDMEGENNDMRDRMASEQD